jgi:hypothetical protein
LLLEAGGTASFTAGGGVAADGAAVTFADADTMLVAMKAMLAEYKTVLLGLPIIQVPHPFLRNSK